MNYEYDAVIKTILDANTVELAVDLGFGLTIRRVFSVIGAKAPTFRDAKTDQEALEAEKAKKEVIEFAAGAKVYCKSHKLGRYGRYTAELIFEDGETFTQKLTKSGY